MKLQKIITLTVNPSLDKSSHFKGLVPAQKIRCDKPHYDAGGGGINVSKAISRLGGSSLCIFTSGGSSGKMLEGILQKEKIESKVIHTQNWTRENFIAFENTTKLQYRFGFPGNELLEDEKQSLLEIIKKIKTEYLVISGSLNEGLTGAYYQKIITITKSLGTKVVADTSGEALQKVLETGVFMIKPNIGELAKLIGVEKLKVTEVEKAAKILIAKGNAEIIVVSLGAEGGLLITKDKTEFVAAPKVATKSTVGAGDSMVGGMVWALSQNKTLNDVLRWGIACGTAATMNEGTQLFKKGDASLLFQRMKA
jgi:6-phosphofructokinase 2